MSLTTGLTLIMFALKLLCLFPHSWLVVFMPQIIVGSLYVVLEAAKALLIRLR